MVPIPMQDVLYLAVTLFVLGLIGLLTRRNLIFTLMSVEIMLNASGLAFVAGSYRWGQPDGQVMFVFILAMAAAEVSVGLALLRLQKLSSSNPRRVFVCYSSRSGLAYLPLILLCP